MLTKENKFLKLHVKTFLMAPDYLGSNLDTRFWKKFSVEALTPKPWKQQENKKKPIFDYALESNRLLSTRLLRVKQTVASIYNVCSWFVTRLRQQRAKFSISKYNAQYFRGQFPVLLVAWSLDQMSYVLNQPSALSLALFWSNSSSGTGRDIDSLC